MLAGDDGLSEIGEEACVQRAFSICTQEKDKVVKVPRVAGSEADWESQHDGAKAINALRTRRGEEFENTQGRTPA